MAKGSDGKSNNKVRPDEKSEEQHIKLVEKFQSILSGELWFMIPTMFSITQMDRLSPLDQANAITGFLLIAVMSLSAWILSHTLVATRWSGLVSDLTQLVTICCVGLLHLMAALQTPPEHPSHLWVNLSLLFFNALMVISLWKVHFPLPEPKRISKED